MNGVGWSMQQLQQQLLLLLLLSEPHCVAQAAARLTTAPSQWQAATTASAHAPAHTLGSTHSPPGAAQGVLCPFQREQVLNMTWHHHHQQQQWQQQCQGLLVQQYSQQYSQWYM